MSGKMRGVGSNGLNDDNFNDGGDELVVGAR